jgi:hypothetical protein
MARDAHMQRGGQRLLKHLQTDGFVPIEAPRNLGADKAADLVWQCFQLSTQAFAGIHVFKHQLLVALD